MKLYRAIIWIADRPGQRVSVLAETAKEAKEKLEAEYGKGNLFNAYNEEEAKRPRQALGPKADDLC